MQAIGQERDRAAACRATLAPDPVPRHKELDPRALARKVQADGGFRITVGGLAHWVEIRRRTAPLIAAIGSGRSFGDIVRGVRLDRFAFAQGFGPAWRAPTGVKLLSCSQGLER